MEQTARRIVITGVTSGLGRALVDGFARRGHVVCGCGRTATAIEDLARELPSPHDFAIVDVADDAAVGEWARHVLSLGSAPDLLINNAALMNELAPLWQVPEREFSRLIDVNVKGVANVIRHFVPPMIARGSGVIVNVSSGWGRSVDRDVAPYCTSKWAVEGLTQALAEELPGGMAAVALNPGVIDTPMLRKCWGDSAGSYPGPQAWVERAVPMLLGLGAQHNGRSMSVG